MIGTVCDREVELLMAKTTATSSPLVPTMAPITVSQNATTIPATFIPAITNLITKVESNGSNPDEEEKISALKLEIAVSLALLVGIFQVRLFDNMCFMVLTLRS
jgi:hypothetical protein